MIFRFINKRRETLLSLPKTFMPDRKVVCIQGLGFVGAAMALAVANAKDAKGQPLYNVIGVDVPNEAGHRKVMSINNGEFPFENNDRKIQQAQKEAFVNGNIWAVADDRVFALADIVVVDINLDIKYGEKDEPILDLVLFKEAMRTLGSYIKEGTLVIVETTVPPGTCEKIVKPIIVNEFIRRGLNSDKVLIAHSYERVMPGENYFDSIVNFWRVYSGINKESADQCQTFLENVIRTDKYPLVRLQGTTSTEIAKVLENSYRAVNIAFMEEWGRFAEEIGVDLFEIIDAVRMRPTHSNMRQPGFGVGGYCLTKDPYFAPLAAKEIFKLDGMEFVFSTNAVRINNVMPLVSLNKIEKLLGNNLKGKNLLVLGVSYRQDVGDTRYSPTEIFVREALERGARVVCQDPLVSDWIEMNLPVLSKMPDFCGFDAIVFTVQHKEYLDIDFQKVDLDDGTLIFDANCVLEKEQRQAIKNRERIILASIGR